MAGASRMLHAPYPGGDLKSSVMSKIFNKIFRCRWRALSILTSAFSLLWIERRQSRWQQQNLFGMFEIGTIRTRKTSVQTFVWSSAFATFRTFDECIPHFRLMNTILKNTRNISLRNFKFHSKCQVQVVPKPIPSTHGVRTQFETIPTSEL